MTNAAGMTKRAYLQLVGNEPSPPCDIDPIHHRVAGRRLSPKLWATFELMREARGPVYRIELIDAGLLWPRHDADASSTMRARMRALRKALAGTRFEVITMLDLPGKGSGYELIAIERKEVKCAAP